MKPVFALVVDTALFGIVVSEVVLLLAYIGAMVIRGDAFVRHSVQDASHFMDFYAHCGCFCFIRQVQGLGAESEPWRNAPNGPILQ